jgi:hypothetical protein
MLVQQFLAGAAGSGAAGPSRTRCHMRLAMVRIWIQFRPVRDEHWVDSKCADTPKSGVDAIAMIAKVQINDMRDCLQRIRVGNGS